jgi:hypothetical protein
LRFYRIACASFKCITSITFQGLVHNYIQKIVWSIFLLSSIIGIYGFSTSSYIFTELSKIQAISIPLYHSHIQLCVSTCNYSLSSLSYCWYGRHYPKVSQIWLIFKAVLCLCTILWSCIEYYSIYCKHTRSQDKQNVVIVFKIKEIGCPRS